MFVSALCVDILFSAARNALSIHANMSTSPHDSPRGLSGRILMASPRISSQPQRPTTIFQAGRRIISPAASPIASPRTSGDNHRTQAPVSASVPAPVLASAPEPSQTSASSSVQRQSTRNDVNEEIRRAMAAYSGLTDYTPAISSSPAVSSPPPAHVVTPAASIPANVPPVSAESPASSRPVLSSKSTPPVRSRAQIRADELASINAAANAVMESISKQVTPAAPPAAPPAVLPAREPSPPIIPDVLPVSALTPKTPKGAPLTHEVVAALLNGYFRLDRSQWDELLPGAMIRYFKVANKSGQPKIERFVRGGRIVDITDGIITIQSPLYSIGGNKVSLRTIDEIWKLRGQGVMIELNLLYKEIRLLKAEIAELKAAAKK